MPATRARLEESESVPTTTAQPQTVSRTLGKISLEINGLALRARRPIAIVGPKMPGNRQGLPPPQAPNSKDPSGVNEAGVLFKLEEAAPKGIKSATNFHPQTRF